MEHVIVDPRWRRDVAALGWRSTADILAAFGMTARPHATRTEVIEADFPTATTPHATTAPARVFVKRYGYRFPTWRFFGRRSKARREFENYAAFERIGLNTAQRVLCAEQRDGLGRLAQAVIVTVAIEGARPLHAHVEATCADSANPAHARARRDLAAQIAAMLRMTHDAGFRHHDLHWRNALVAERAGRPTVYWIDCPRGHAAPRLLPDRPFVLKDLATLDRVGRRVCTLRERVRFLRMYLGDVASPGSGASLAREVARFSAARRQWRRKKPHNRRA